MVAAADSARHGKGTMEKRGIGKGTTQMQYYEHSNIRLLSREGETEKMDLQNSRP